MSFKLVPAVLITIALYSSAPASTPIDPDPALSGTTYTFHENLHVGQKIRYFFTDDSKINSTSTVNGTPTVTDIDSGHTWKVTLTVQAQKDGSATQLEASVDPDSFATSRVGTGDPQKTPCTFAGKIINLTRHPDESITDDSKADPANTDVSTIDSFIVPDEDNYPDKPVAVGDTWDSSDKAAKHAQLGPKDQLKSIYHLDWVKTIDGKQIAQISGSNATIHHEDGNVEEDQQSKITMLVDIAAGSIIKCDQTGSSKYSTPPTEPIQVTGGCNFSYHVQVLANATATSSPPATQP